MMKPKRPRVQDRRRPLSDKELEYYLDHDVTDDELDFISSEPNCIASDSPSKSVYDEQQPNIELQMDDDETQQTHDTETNSDAEKRLDNSLPPNNLRKLHFQKIKK